MNKNSGVIGFVRFLKVSFERLINFKGFSKRKKETASNIFNDCIIEGSKTIRHSRFTNCRINKVTLIGCTLYSCILDDCTLIDCNLDNCNLNENKKNSLLRVSAENFKFLPVALVKKGLEHSIQLNLIDRDLENYKCKLLSIDISQITIAVLSYDRDKKAYLSQISYTVNLDNWINSEISDIPNFIGSIVRVKCVENISATTTEDTTNKFDLLEEHVA